MDEKSISEQIQKLLDEHGYEIKVEPTPGHLPLYHSIDHMVMNLVKSTLKFDVIITKKK